MCLTNVCSRWRMVAVNTPELWALVPCWTSDRTAKVLKRAKEAPLKVKYREVYVQNRDQRNHDLLDLLGRIDRVRHLELQCHNFSVEETGGALVNALYRRAPILEHLRIVDPRNSGSIRIDSAQLFSQQAPRLRHLWFESCTLVPSDFLRFSSLQTLRLRKVKSLSLKCFMRSLGAMPALRNIHLQDAIEGTDDEQWTDMTPIQLPFLRTLVVTDPVAVVLCLAKHLLAVQLSQIDFTCTQLGSDDLIELLSNGLIPDGILQFRDKLVSANIDATNYYNRLGTYSFAVSSSPRPTWADKRIPLVVFRIKATGVAPLLSGTTDAFKSMLLISSGTAAFTCSVHRFREL
jgi:hypothetical protein